MCQFGIIRSSYRHVHFKHTFLNDSRMPGLHVSVEVSLAYQDFTATIAPAQSKRNIAMK